MLFFLKRSNILFFSVCIIVLVTMHSAIASGEGEDEWRKDFLRTKTRLAEIPEQQKALYVTAGDKTHNDGRVRTGYHPEGTHLCKVHSRPGMPQVFEACKACYGSYLSLQAEQEGLLARQAELEKRVRVIESKEADDAYLRSLAILKAEAELKALGIALPPKT
jgi:hypothetical protein